MNYFCSTWLRLQKCLVDSYFFKNKNTTKDLISSNIPLTLYYTLLWVFYVSSMLGDIIKNFEGFVQANLPDLWIERGNKTFLWQYPLDFFVDSLGLDIS